MKISTPEINAAGGNISSFACGDASRGICKIWKLRTYFSASSFFYFSFSFGKKYKSEWRLNESPSDDRQIEQESEIKVNEKIL